MSKDITYNRSIILNNNKSDWKRECGKKQDRKAKSEARKNRKIRREVKWMS